MIVKITYDDKRLDVFDTATFTCPAPLGKQNMLTNFEVRFDEMGTEGLWLAAHSYRIDDSTASNTEADEVPIARRKKGWRFLLSSSEELDHVELVVVDGEAIIKRVCGELVDLQSFDEKAYECIGASSKGAARAHLRPLRVPPKVHGRGRASHPRRSLSCGTSAPRGMRQRRE